ncbi:MAG: acyltransferase [Clostridia bacterium]|nr:acyltransferase [Clostridia bacterium]
MSKAFFHKIERLVFGSYKMALKEGLHAGKGVSVMGNCEFGSEPYLITLGDHVRISFGVSFVTHDGGTWSFRDIPQYSKIIKYGKIYIGERSFVGCNSTIMPGVTIGKRCVIAAGSVVTKDIPDGMVAAGVPAKVIMTTMEYAEKCLRTMKPYDSEKYKHDKKTYLQELLK